MSLRLLRLLCLLGAFSCVVVFTSCGGNTSASTPPTQPVPTLTFSADTTNIAQGGQVTLSWASSNATSVTISPSVSSSPLPLSGSQQISPSATTTYTATATGAGGTAKQQVTVTVTTAATPTVTFTASANSVTAGSLVTLTWATTNATSFTVSPSILGEDQTALDLSGSTTVVISSTTTFNATATGPGGTAKASVTVAATQTAPTITFAASPTSVAPGSSSTLTWTTTNATSVSIDNGVGSNLAANANAVVTPSSTTTYTATATGPGGTATATATVTVQSGLAISLTASPTSITSGSSSTLTWSTSGGTGTVSVTITGVSGTQSSSGTVSVSPTATTTYTATATDSASNTATATASVTVVSTSGGLSSIKHIIFMIQENRTFDNYFGKLGAYKANEGLTNDVNDLDTLPSGFGLKTRSDAPNPGIIIPPFHERTLQTENLSPSWNESHYDAHIVGNDYLNVTASSQFKMDNFLQTTHSVSPDKYDPDGTRPMGYYDQTDLPYYYELASQFAISDNFHSSLLSQTNPNRMYLFGATSIGRCNADPTGHPLWPETTIFDNLVAAGVSWRYYYQDGVFLAQFQSWNNPKIQGNVYNISNLFQVLAAPNADQQLPHVIFIERGSQTDEHPDNNIQAGAVYVKSIIDALMASNAWQDTIFILAFDEGGGLYDHVPPLMVPEPDSIAPNCPSLTPANFDLSGFRVPMVVISPYAIPHYVSHTPMETTSILNLIEERFGLQPLTNRDGQAPKMDEFFDFSNPAWLTPPPLPTQPNECLTNSSRCNQQLETYPNLP